MGKEGGCMYNPASSTHKKNTETPLLLTNPRLPPQQVLFLLAALALCFLPS